MNLRILDVLQFGQRLVRFETLARLEGTDLFDLVSFDVALGISLSKSFFGLEFSQLNFLLEDDLGKFSETCLRSQNQGVAKLRGGRRRRWRCLLVTFEGAAFGGTLEVVRRRGLGSDWCCQR